ncbi:MAG: GNAT family N-acetyltransferase [Actinobacteria bacterium]|nr:GNAT family N-acetyltransferase [Actinomycetota bacterium]
MQQWFQGYGEPAFVFGHLAPELDAVLFIHTDSAKNTVDLDLFTDCAEDTARELFGFGIEWVRANRTGFKVRSAGNKNDASLHALLVEFGFVHYRDYWKLVWRNLPTEFKINNPRLEIRAVSFEVEAELIHRLEADSFSEHFGYVAIDFPAWLTQRNSIESIDPNGFLIAYYDSKPAGFLIADDSRADQNGGWVDKLGVSAEFRGLGIGKALLNYAGSYYAARGFSSVALGADTGNDSGALDLYFGLGFTPMLIWRAMQLPSLS